MRTIRKLFLVALSVLCAAAAQAQAVPAWQRIELGAAAGAYPFAIYSNKPWTADMRRVKSAVLVFHGGSRNGDDYYAAAEKLLKASGASEDETLLIAPNFFAAADGRKQPIDGMPLWEGDKGWNGGWDSASWGRPLSSFQPIDDLLQSLSDRKRFPALERITVAGHSGGGQIVHRYAVLNNADEKVRAAGIDLRYIIANPSSYLYFTNERPKETAFTPYDAAACPTYNEYRYGLDKMVRYAGNVDGPVLFKRYAARDVTYLLGTADNDPNHRSIDKSCGAKANGAYRFERGKNYIRYEQYLAGSAVRLNRHAYEVVGVGHDQAKMFGSKCGASLLFGMPAAANAAGAECRAPDH
jgi:pimeloyl-ACP methyl ester carboxylesterase